MKFKDRLRILLDSNQCTSYKIWKATGVSQQLLSKYLSGQIEPKGVNLSKIAAFFNVSSGWLLTGLGDMRTDKNAGIDRFFATGSAIKIFNRPETTLRFIAVLSELKERGTNYTAIAHKIGVSPALLTEIRKNRSQVTPDTLKKLSDNYAVNLTWLTNGSGNKFLNMGAEAPQETKSSIVSSSPAEWLNLPFVPGHTRTLFAETLTTGTTKAILKLTGINYKDGCIFEIDGDHMEPTLINGEQVFCEQVPHTDWKYITGPVVVVFGNNMVTLKRIRENTLHEGELILWPDSELGGKITLSYEQDRIKYLYKIKYSVYRPIR